MQINKNKNIATQLNYKNILRSLFINTNYSYTIANTNLLYSVAFNGVFQTKVASLYNNDRLSQLGFLSISKYFTKLKSSLLVKATFSSTKYLALLQNVIGEYKNNNYTGNIKTITDINNFTFLTYNCEWTKSLNYLTQKPITPKP